jgi:hypothetical protein
MDGSSAFFARPQAELMLLQVDPVLASWDSKESSSQRRLGLFLGHATHMIAPRLARLGEEPVALRMHVGLPALDDWLEHHDLDNYAFPLVMRLHDLSERQLDCVWVTKSRRTGSGIAVGRAQRCDPPSGAVTAQLRTHASAETRQFKEQIRDAFADLHPLPDGPVALEISYGVGPGRNWPHLWKPTIDSLGALLGSDGGDWHPRDGRITELGLHRLVDPSLGHDVDITVAARPSPTP